MRNGSASVYLLNIRLIFSVATATLEGPGLGISVPWYVTMRIQWFPHDRRTLFSKNALLFWCPLRRSSYRASSKRQVLLVESHYAPPWTAFFSYVKSKIVDLLGPAKKGDAMRAGKAGAEHWLIWYIFCTACIFRSLCLSQMRLKAICRYARRLPVENSNILHDRRYFSVSGHVSWRGKFFP